MAPELNGPVVGSRIAPTHDVAFPAPLVEVSGLPNGFPAMLDSPLAWSGRQFKSDSDYVFRLEETHLIEIDHALQEFKKLGLDGDLVSTRNFALPTLGPKLLDLQRDIYCGKGFGLVRGLDPQRYSVEDLTTIYMGIQCYIANLQGRQDKKGNMLVHIIADNSTKMKAMHHRHSTAPITFHNEEAGDIISWLTRSTAVSGGKCILASVYTVYNALAASRPDLVRILARSDWPFALPRFQCRPVLFYHDRRIISNFGRAALLGSASHVRPDRLPKLNSIQIEALDAIERIAQATQLEITTQAGDIHFINNLAVLHRREGFTNGSSTTEKRHLVRMRLRDSEMGWSIPNDLKDEWVETFDPKLNRVWHLESMPDGFFPLRSQAN
ncbi:TfdA family Taurine catabolism dioxygenase TauD, partial [Metarhizium majus ARSEF 297]